MSPVVSWPRGMNRQPNAVGEVLQPVGHGIVGDGDRDQGYN